MTLQADSHQPIAVGRWPPSYNAPMTSPADLLPRKPSIEWIDLRVQQLDFVGDVVAGLGETPRRIAAKYFYDTAGSDLFEQITELPEYYLTRTELSILRHDAPAMVAHFGSRHALVEFGSGSSTKVRLLLDAAGPQTATYMPIDLSAEFLRESALSIAAAYPALEVIAVCADYTALPLIPESSATGKRVVYFPGSTLGNLEPSEAKRFFQHTASILKPRDGMLIGVDLRKSTSILNAAYNDSKGVTAEFNLNLLRRLNRELDAGFDVDSFEHVAFYNEEEGRIEMHLRATRAQQVEVSGHRFDVAAGELIHTENSYKYDEASFGRLLAGSGFEMKASWTDEGSNFAVHYLEINA
jgi:dimethylhistidine N-methyltransferase